MTLIIEQGTFDPLGTFELSNIQLDHAGRLADEMRT